MNTPTHYLVNVGHSLSLNNKLQSEYSQFLNTLSGVLVEAKDKDNLICKIIEKSVELSEKHSRCKPLSIHFDLSYDKKGLALRGFEYLSVKLLFGYYEQN